jgi:leucyl-tRNA synthetase
MTDEAWDAVFLGGDYPTDAAAAPQPALERMRREFEFWYPMNLRVSGERRRRGRLQEVGGGCTRASASAAPAGKDLIQNHLTMSLYNHSAVWGGRADRMPQGFFANGHVMVDG